MKLPLQSLAYPLLGALLLFSSCKKDDEKTEFDRINDWIYANMEFYYFWTEELPSKKETSIDPNDFFKSLLSDKDRFSFIYDDYQELVNLLNGVSLESGFEYQLYLEGDNSTNVIMQLLYIKANSPAADLGLQRGDIIYEINGTQMTSDNYRSLLTNLNSSYDITYRRYNSASDTSEDKGSASITPIVYSENPFLLDSVYEIEGKKIGYLIYTFYSPGTDDVYDIQMDAIFSNFKAQGIQDFVLDLRFNSGGSETSVRNLTSLIVKNATSSDLVFKKTYNEQVREQIINDDDLGEDFLNVQFLEKAENIGSQLATGTVYILTSDRSASASEVTINSLKPYMDVFIVGDTTVGKDVGSITINDQNNANNNWALQPIIVKLVNSSDEDYPAGHFPDIVIESNFLKLKPLGDVEETLLANALAAIGVTSARVHVPTRVALKRLHSSLDNKVYNGSFLLENELKSQE